jgi:hypothetical protein
MRKKLAVLVAGLTAAGIALVGPAAASPANAATQGSCQTGTDFTASGNHQYFAMECTTLPDGLKYFPWVQCNGNVWAFGPTELGTSGAPSLARCPSGTVVTTMGANLNQGVCPVGITDNAVLGVSCTALPFSLSYFAWVHCSGNAWNFGSTFPGTSGNLSLAVCPSGQTILQGGFNVG